MMMKSFFLNLIVVASATQSEITPVQKVVALLEGMLEKGKKDKHEEQVQFAIFKKFCDEEVHVKEVAIDEEVANIDHLTVDIRKERATANKMGHDISKLDQDISTWNGDIKAATKVREIEKNDYSALHEDYSDSIDALMRAIQTLKNESHDRKQASGLVQLTALKDLDLIPASAKKAVDAFLQHGGTEYDEGLAVSAPEANAYEFQSAGVIEMLEKLLDKFMDERRSIEKQEVNSKQAYDILMQDLKGQIAEATERRNSKAVSKSKQLEMKADDKGARVEETDLKTEDTKYKSDLEATCKVKTDAFESRQQLRADEIGALERAIKIIGSDAVVVGARKHLPTLMQSRGASFSQLRAGNKHWNDVATYLQERARKLNSRILAVIAEKAAVDPFVKVKKMIKDLLARLMEEAAEEAEHKGWCDTELTTNAQTRKEKTAAVETLHAEIDVLQASIAKLTEDIRELTHAVADLDAAMSKQTKIRNEEKAKNRETISDAKDAQAAVEQGLNVLREFYVKAADATALVQKKQTPEIFDGSYKGMQGKSEEVIGMLEVIQTDFARLESSTKAAEDSAQRDYDTFMEDSKADKSGKETALNHKESKKVDDSAALAARSRDLGATQKELDAALTYYDKLKPSCVDAGTDYGDRVARREEEIASLKEALQHLNGETI